MKSTFLLFVGLGLISMSSVAQTTESDSATFTAEYSNLVGGETLDCPGLPNGMKLYGYRSPNPPCIMTSITCVDGVLSGPMPYPFCNPMHR